MTIAPGRTLAHYEILAPLGAGAMGEVWRARDSRLGREVAIKVLPEHFASDAERLQRFEREARTLATLNHPNVAQIFGVDQVDDTCFLVLELVEGETLEERLRRGPLPLDEALDICRQIAEGLEAAHEAGVIHRDLKPANIRITPQGAVKVLDFGLAKPMRGDDDVKSSIDSVLSTETGRLLGTPTYMAPEQARGKSIDKRVDIWAFGCVLYECLTARRAFEGETLSDVFAAVLKQEPDLARLATAPARVLELLARCLEKDPRSRLRDAGEARVILAAPLPKDGTDRAAAGRTVLPRRRGWIVVAWIASVGAAAALTWLLVQGAEVAAEPVIRATLLLPQDLSLSPTEQPLALSPDGRMLAIVASLPAEPYRLWIRPLDSSVPQPLSGTEGAVFPFWSPDGQTLAFIAEGKLKRIPATGGSVTTICASEDSRGGAWGRDGTIVFAPAAFGPLYRVAATGGTPTPITTTTGSESHRLPHFLPDGRRVLYAQTNSDRDGIRVLDLASGQSVQVADERSGGLFAPPGLLLFVRDQNLMAQSFDVEALALTGEPRLLVENVTFNVYRFTGSYSVSTSGDLVYVAASDQRQLQWFDAEGRPGDPLGSPARLQGLCLSPDGRQVAANIGREGGACDLWLLDTQRGLGSKLAENVAAEAPLAWFPDGRTIAYARTGAAGSIAFKTVLRELDGLADEREFAPGWPSDVSPDGAWLILNRQVPGTGLDQFCGRTDGSAEPTAVAATAATELGGVFSPDGKWITLQSDSSGRSELHVQPFPGPGPSQQLTSMGVGSDAEFAWLTDGRVVYATAADRTKVWTIEVKSRGQTLEIGTPVPFFGGRDLPQGPLAISKDGTRLLIAVLSDEVVQRSVNLVRNWPATIGREGQ